MKALVVSICTSLVVANTAFGQLTRLASSNEHGKVAKGGAGGTSCSEDGRLVVIWSAAKNLISGKNNRASDAFVKDLRTGAIECASETSSGAEANGDAHFPRISADGRFVVFYSYATNLVSGDKNGRSDVFVRDRVLGTTTRVSLSSTGKEADQDCSLASISSDGRFVVFESIATNLVANDTNDVSDVFLVDTVLGTIERVSIDSAGVQGNGASRQATVSADGTLVAFMSEASNLEASDFNDATDVFVRDRSAGTTFCVSVNPAGLVGNAGSDEPAISLDGSAVAFHSQASDLIVSDTIGGDVFVRKLTSTQAIRVSVDSSGAEANSYSDLPAISRDGTRVTFRSHATNLVPGDTNGFDDVFVHDLVTGVTERVSVDDAGGDANLGAQVISGISPDGRWIVFMSSSTNLDPADTNTDCDVYVRSLDGVDATSASYGSGLPGANGIPALVALADPVIGLDLSIQIDDSANGPIAGVLFVGFSRMSIPFKGGTLLVNWVQLLPLALVPPSIVMTGTIPDDAALNGLLIDLQALEFDVAAPQGVSFTPGLELQLGY